MIETTATTDRTTAEVIAKLRSDLERVTRQRDEAREASVRLRFALAVAGIRSTFRDATLEYLDDWRRANPRKRLANLSVLEVREHAERVCREVYATKKRKKQAAST